MLSTISRRRRSVAPRVEGLESIISLSHSGIIVSHNRVNIANQVASLAQGNGGNHSGGNSSVNAGAIVQQSNQAAGGDVSQSTSSTVSVSAHG